MQFIVTGYDGSDAQAPARRQAARAAHLALFREKVDQGLNLFGSAILDEDSQMVGSLIICEYPSRAALEETWLKIEPYVTGDVWQRVEVTRAQVPAFLMPPERQTPA